MVRRKARKRAAPEGALAARIGDRVRLLRTAGGTPKGSEGVVTDMNDDGSLLVTIDRTPACGKTMFVLPPLRPEDFTTETRCP